MPILNAAAIHRRLPRLLRLDLTGREHRWFVRLGERLGFDATVVLECGHGQERELRILGQDDSALALALEQAAPRMRLPAECAVVVGDGHPLFPALRRAGHRRGVLLALGERSGRCRAILVAGGPRTDDESRNALLDAATLLHQSALQTRRSLSLGAEIMGLRRESQVQRRELLELRAENLRSRRLMHWLEQLRSFVGTPSELLALTADAVGPILDLSALVLLRPDRESLVAVHAPDLAGATLDGVLRQALFEAGLGHLETFRERETSVSASLVGLLRGGSQRGFVAPKGEVGDRLLGIRFRDSELRIEERELLEQFAWPMLERLASLERHRSDEAERVSLQRRVEEYSHSERMARALREQRLFEQLLESLPTAVLLVTPRGELRFLNPAAMELLGLRGAAPEDLSELERGAGLALRHLLDDEANARELRWGSDRHLRVEMQRVSDEEDLPLGVLITLRDITRRKRLELEQSEFVGSVSHELRTPLTSMRAALELVLQRAAGDLSEEQEHFLEMGRRNIDRLAQLIERLLDVARHDDGRLKLDRKSMELSELLADCVGNLRSKAEKEGRRVELRLEAGAAAYVDPVRFPEIVENLLGNALKFTEPGGLIELRVECDQDSPDATARMLGALANRALTGVRLTVRDDGCGMSSVDRARAFERFHQAGDPLTGRPQGVGLGLAITKALVAGHDGAIDLNSELGRGTEAIVWIPQSAEDAAVSAVVVRLGRALEELQRGLRAGVMAVLRFQDEAQRESLQGRWNGRELPGSWPTSRVGDHAFALLPEDDWRPSLLQDAVTLGIPVGLARFPADGRSVGTLLAVALRACGQRLPAAASTGGPP